MKKIISLVILSLFFEGYLNACTVSGDGCSVPEEGKLCVRIEETCVEKTLCTAETDAACANTQASNPVTKKCVEITIDTDNKKCVEEDKKCVEITTGGTETICGGAGVSDEKKKCVLENTKCVEVEKETAETTAKNSTKSSSKTEEKNAANYLNLSFALLFLFFI